jgi:aarF domain-containing kinase
MDGGLQDARTVFNAPRWPSSAAAGAPAATPAAAQSGELADAHSAAAAHAPAEPQILQTSDAPRQDPEPAQQPTAAAAPPAKVPAPPAPAAPKKFKFVAREASVPSNSVTRAFGFASLGASLLLGTARESVSRAWRGGKPAGGGAAAAAGEDGGPAVYSAFLSEGNAERLAGALCRMRGAALKLGQMLSIQDDSLLPPQFKAALDRVRAGADVMPRRQLDKVLAAELGRDWRSRVADFDDAPLAAASIGQVHAATLHDGRRVVMKIQYPGVAKSIEADVGERGSLPARCSVGARTRARAQPRPAHPPPPPLPLSPRCPAQTT